MNRIPPTFEILFHNPSKLLIFIFSNILNQWFPQLGLHENSTMHTNCAPEVHKIVMIWFSKNIHLNYRLHLQGKIAGEITFVNKTFCSWSLKIKMRWGSGAICLPYCSFTFWIYILQLFWVLMCFEIYFYVTLIFSQCCWYIHCVVLEYFSSLFFAWASLDELIWHFQTFLFSYILCQNTLSNILHHCSEELYFWEIRSPTFLPFCHYSSIYSRFNPPCFMKTVQRYIIEEGSLSSVLEHGNHIRSASW